MFSALQAELKSSARLRLGLALIVAVLWVYGLLLLRDAQDSLQQQHRSASVKLARLQAGTKEGDWAARLESAQTLQSQLESRLWRGDTLGLARAALQDHLNQQMQLAGISRPVVTMGTADEDTKRADSKDVRLTEDLWRVKAKLLCDFNPASLNKLLVQLASQQRGVVVESLRVTKEPVPRVEAVLLAYFQKPDSAAKSAP